MRQWINLFENETKAEAFVDAANHLIASDFSGKVFCDLGTVNATTVEIEEIIAATQRQGWGTAAMTALCELADRMDITLILGVANETDDFFSDAGDPSEDDLIDFYERFSFFITPTMTDRTMMKRIPN